MELTGSKDPVTALKKARKLLIGRKTSHSRIVGTFMGILDAMRVIREIEDESFRRGYEIGRSEKNESEAVKKKKEELELKLLDRASRFLDKLDKMIDVTTTMFSNQMITGLKKSIESKRKVKPKFKVVFEEK